MKTVNNLIDYVQNELQDPTKIMLNRTKAQLIYTVMFCLLAGQVGLYLLFYS